MSVFTAACIQMNSQPGIQKNLEAAGTFVREAALAGATFIATPENTDLMRSSISEKIKDICPMDEHPALSFFSELAAELEVTLLIGSISVLLESGKMHNRSLFFSPRGKLKASYDKIHLCEIDLSNDQCFNECSNVERGAEAVLARIQDDVRLGLTICYDLRFPYMYRDLAQSGAQILAVPSAFAHQTGRAHWEVLLRARAIENSCFVVAPNQCGTHEGGRMTWGHSMIVNPWGEVIAKMENEPGFITAEIDLQKVEKARRVVPAYNTNHTYDLKEV